MKKINRKMNGKTYDLLTLGEILLRLSSRGNERNSVCEIFEKKVGGAELNVACGVSQLGLHTGIISKLPSNSIAEYAIRQIRSNGVETEFLLRDEHKDARIGIYYYEQGAFPRKPEVVYDRLHTAAREMSFDEYPEEMYQKARCFHTSGITLALNENCRNTAFGMIKKFKENGAKISFDVNFRMNLWNGKEAKECIEQILPYVDIFFCSEDTARLTFEKEGSLKEIMKKFAMEYDIEIVASTKRVVRSPKIHDFGSVIYDAKTDEYYEEKPYEGIEVVDRIGSGDTYVAGVLYGLLAEPGNCASALQYGNAAGTMKNTVPGDIPVMNLSELDDMIAEHGNTGYHSEMKR